MAKNIITDINGCDLEIDNLQLAIMQADDYRHYSHLNPKHQQADEKHRAYWENIYHQLIQLQSNIEKQ